MSLTLAGVKKRLSGIIPALLVFATAWAAGSGQPQRDEAPAEERCSATTEGLRTVIDDVRLRERRVDAREAELERREEDLRKLVETLDERIGTHQAILGQIRTQLAGLEEQDEARLVEQARAMAAMKPAKAAELLSTLFARDKARAVAVYGRIEVSKRGKILDAMETDVAASLGQAATAPVKLGDR